MPTPIEVASCKREVSESASSEFNPNAQKLNEKANFSFESLDPFRQEKIRDLQENRDARKWLIPLLASRVTGWLIFTGVVVAGLSLNTFSLTRDNAIHLVMASLLASIGLWWLGFQWKHCCAVFLELISGGLALHVFHFYLSTKVAIAFITTSLATVVGLWAIGLKYYFAKK